MNIPEHILQQVADEAFLSSNGGMMGLLTCNKEKNHVFWHEERYERRAVIQHAISNPALAPFLAGAEPTPPAQAEPAAQVPLGPEDVPPGSVIRYKHTVSEEWDFVTSVFPTEVWTGDQSYSWDWLMRDWQINTSLSDTGRWDKDAWRPCSKPGKEVAK